MNFTIPIHTGNRPLQIDACLNSLEKNSYYKHKVVLAADSDGVWPTYFTDSLGRQAWPVDDTRAHETVHDILYAKWNNFEGAHVEVQIVPFKSSSNRPDVLGWFEGMMIGIAAADTEWVLICAQDDMYFGPNWDFNLVRAQVCTGAECVVPVCVVGFTQSLPVRWLPGDCTECCDSYWLYLERRDRRRAGKFFTPGHEVVDGVMPYYIAEQDILDWVAKTGILKPSIVVSELGGIRQNVGAAPMLMRKALFNSIGGFQMHKFQPGWTDMTLELDGQLGANGKVKVGVQDAITVNARWNVIDLNPAIAGGPAGQLLGGPCIVPAEFLPTHRKHNSRYIDFDKSHPDSRLWFSDPCRIEA